MQVASAQPQGAPATYTPAKPAAEQAPKSVMETPVPQFISPNIRIESGVPVVQFRDAFTGEVTLQIPSEKALKAYKANLATGTPVPLGVELPDGPLNQVSEDVGQKAATPAAAAESETASVPAANADTGAAATSGVDIGA